MRANIIATIVRCVAKHPAIIELWRVHDLTGVIEPVWIEARLDLPEISNDAGAEHRFVKFGANQPVAMLAGVRAFVLAHHLEGFFGDGPHRLDVLFEL